MGRQAAFEALMRVEKDGSYSNIALDHILEKSGLSQRDKKFATMLFYGVLEKMLLLNYNIAVRSQRPLNEIDEEIIVALRMGMYQIFFADSVTDAAAVNETVSLCRRNGLDNAAGFVNGILRAAARDKEPKLPDPKKGKNKYYSIKYSCPEEIIKLWRKSYGDDITIGMLSALSERPPLFVRVNTLKTTAEELICSLQKSGVKAESFGTVDNCLLVYDTGAVEKLPQFREGLFHVQDAASQLCCRVLDPQKNQTMLDVCSAPGGKSFTCAEMMENTGKILSCDLYQSRLSLVKSGAQRLGIDIITTKECDASELDADISADRVLCDVPCSGLGIIRRKPELRYKKDLGLEALPELQYKILCRAAEYVKSGGKLVYSTCTLDPAENSGIVRRFLSEHTDFCPEQIVLPEGIKRAVEEEENELTLFPHISGTDGFFISLMQRK